MKNYHLHKYLCNLFVKSAPIRIPSKEKSTADLLFYCICISTGTESLQELNATNQEEMHRNYKKNQRPKLQ